MISVDKECLPHFSLNDSNKQARGASFIRVEELYSVQQPTLLYIETHTHIHIGTARKNFNMGREEQIEEREVLESIFPEEITG